MPHLEFMDIVLDTFYPVNFWKCLDFVPVVILLASQAQPVHERIMLWTLNSAEYKSADIATAIAIDWRSN